MINYQTQKVLAVSITKAGQVTAIARSRKAGAFVLTDDQVQVVAGAGAALHIQLSPSKGKAALFSFESGTWRPHYPLVETYFLNEAWPLGQGDLNYGNNNLSSQRYDYPEDSDIVLRLSNGEVTWQNSMASPRKFVLQDRPDFIFETLLASLRLRAGIGGSLTISALNANGTAGAQLFQHRFH